MHRITIDNTIKTIFNTGPKRFSSQQGITSPFPETVKIKSVSLHEETASADKGATEKCHDTFRQIIEGKKYKPEQVLI